MAVYAGPDIVENGLVLHLDAANFRSYPGSGVTWNNLTISNNAILVNGPIFDFNNQGFIRCDGGNDYIQILDYSSLDFGSTNFTVEYWFKKLANTSSFTNIWGPNKWSVGSAPGTNEWVLTIGNGDFGNNNAFGFYIASTDNVFYSTGPSTTLLTLNVWYQLIGMRDGATLKTYLNGVINQNVTPSGMTAGTAIANVAGRNLTIGTNDGKTGLYTNVDTAILRIYNKALNETEIQQNFNALRGRFNL